MDFKTNSAAFSVIPQLDVLVQINHTMRQAAAAYNSADSFIPSSVAGNLLIRAQ